MTGEPVLLRYCSALAVLALFAPLLLLSIRRADAAEQARPEKMWVFIGTYTGKVSKGIYRCELDLATGKLSRRVRWLQRLSALVLASSNHVSLYALPRVDFGARRAAP